MANILTENFTGSNGTQINGYNSWVASATGLQIQSDKAAKTDDGGVWAYKSASGWTGARTASCVFSKYTGPGNRYFNQFILGSSDISNLTNFQNNSMYVYVFRSGSSHSNSGVYIFDGTTIVASNLSPGFQFDGTDLRVTVTMNADGSGNVRLEQGTSEVTVSWTARTWTNGTGQYHGFYFDHSGTDGEGQITRSQIDNIYINTGLKKMDFLVVGGGGSGGAGGGGGGGAGAHKYLTSQLATPGSYTVTVGAGGAAVSGSDIRGNNGADSVFNWITSLGGGGGGAYGNSSPQRNGKDGGSGGGGGWGSGSGTAAGGTATLGGNVGGTGQLVDSSAGGGGGGAGAVGGNSSGTTGGNGGNGLANSITGTSVTRAGGGGGGMFSGSSGGAGGTGGGGAGTSGTVGNNATANTGSGGGATGSPSSTSGAGGSGVVIVRLLTADWTTITGGTQTTDGSYTVCTFTSSSTLTLSESAPPSVNSGFFRLM